MQSFEISKGSRKVIATRNDEQSRWHARLYVNRGETATLQHCASPSRDTIMRWVEKVLGGFDPEPWGEGNGTYGPYTKDGAARIKAEQENKP